MDTPFFPSWWARLAAFGGASSRCAPNPCPTSKSSSLPSCPPAFWPRPHRGTTAANASIRCAAPSGGFSGRRSIPAPPAARRHAKSRRCSARLAKPAPWIRRAAPIARPENACPWKSSRAPAPPPPITPKSSCRRDRQLWRGRRPKVVDGTTLSLADTPANQRAYPQLQSQKPGCGFPLLKLTGLFSLASGALLGYAKGNKHRAELPLLFQLRKLFASGDLLLGDRGFCSYVLMALLERMGVACLFRLHHARPHDLRAGIRLGRNDRLVVWHKPQQKPRYLPKSLWRRIPEELLVRVLRVQARIPGLAPRPSRW